MIAEKALVSLPSPLTASDEHILHRGDTKERIIVTAGLHRQVWVSGTNIFADVHIINNSHKTIKKLELQLERIILCYRHTVAATLEMSASQARLFDQLERTIVCKTSIKRGTQGWNGVLPYTTDLRTCNLELPRGHATIKCNKYFEVRYYLNIIIGSSHQKLVTVQLPIILIHMNSLDVPTNSVDQVVAAIEEKRSRHALRHDNKFGTAGGVAGTTTSQGSPRLGRKLSRTLQGRAFSAPRTASLERQRAHAEELRQLGQVLDNSPRKHKPFFSSRNNSQRNRPQYQHQQQQGYHRGRTQSHDEDWNRDLHLGGWADGFSFKTPPSNRKGRVILDDDADALRRTLASVRSFGSLRGTNAIAIAHGALQHGSSGARGENDHYVQSSNGKGKRTANANGSVMKNSTNMPMNLDKPLPKPFAAKRPFGPCMRSLSLSKEERPDTPLRDTIRVGPRTSLQSSRGERKSSKDPKSADGATGVSSGGVFSDTENDDPRHQREKGKTRRRRSLSSAAGAIRRVPRKAGSQRSLTATGRWWDWGGKSRSRAGRDENWKRDGEGMDLESKERQGGVNEPEGERGKGAGEWI